MEETSQAVIGQEKTNQKSIGYILILATTLILFIMKVPFGTSIFEADKKLLLSAGVGLVFFIWLFKRLKDNAFLIPNSIVLKTGLVLFGVSILATVFSIQREVSFIGLGFESGTLISLVVFLLLAFLGSIFFQSKVKIASLYWVLLLGFFIATVVQILHVAFGWTFGILTSAVTSNLIGRWYDFAIIAGMVALTSVISLTFSGGKIISRYLAWFSFWVALAVLAFTNFAIAWWVLAVMSMVILMHSFLQTRWVSQTSESETSEVLTASTEASWKPQRIAVSILFIFSLAFIIWGGEGQILSRVTSAVIEPPLEVRPSFRGTGVVIKETISDQPILGIGPNLFAREWVQHKAPEVNESVFWNLDFNSGISHLSSTLVTHGIVGFVAWIAFLLAIFYTGLRALFLAQIGTRGGFQVLLVVLSTIYLWMFSIVYIPNTVVLALTFLWTGLQIATLATSGFVKNWYVALPRKSIWGSAVTGMVVVTLLLSVSGGYLITQKYRALAGYEASLRALSTNNDPQGALSVLNKTLDRSPADLFYREQSNFLMTNLVASLANKDLDDEATQAEFAESYAEVLKSAQDAVEWDQSNYLNWLRLADVYESVVSLGVPGAFEQSREALLQAGRLNQQNPSIPMRLANLELAAGNNEEAKKYTNIALALKNNYSPAYRLAAQIAVSEGDLDTGIQNAEFTALSSPRDATAFFLVGYLRFQNGDFEEAVGALERAVILTPNYSDAKYFLGLGYYQQGQIDSAIAQFEDVLVLNPGNVDVENIIANLRDGRAPFAQEVAPVLDEEAIDDAS